MKNEKQEILELISLGKARLSEIEKERDSIISNLNILRKKLEANDKNPLNSDNAATLNPDEKINLFQRLFRGREDVFPKLWISSKSSRKGYAPACANDWVYGLCGKGKKPPVKCGVCENKAYIPITRKIIKDHLQGKHVIGTYPLLADETCWFLAVDFDKASWQKDVSAFRSTSRSLGLEPAIERSRSGNGAHAWFFFSEPIKASVARNMGCFLITETMSQHHELSMGSYDRLFPNQDTMPSGGFGNLIALPLQAGPRKNGNSVFVDDEFLEYPDQWGFLVSIKKISCIDVQKIADRAISQNKVIGLDLPASDDEQCLPWEKNPSGNSSLSKIKEKLPVDIKAVIAQKIFVEKAGLPSSLINRIKRLAAFQNPEFFKKQNMRLSTALTPRVISCFEDLPDYVALPRGCIESLKNLLEKNEVTLSIQDNCQKGIPNNFDFHGKLDDKQQQAVDEFLKHDCGVLVAPPGSGKTVIGTYLIATRRCSTLILVHRKPLIDQWISELSKFLNLSPKSIGIIGAGKNRPTKNIDVAMIQSLIRNNQVSDIVADYGLVIVDECHHLSAVSFEKVLSEVKARFVSGLTATPFRRDGHHPIIHFQCGPIRYSMNTKKDEDFRFSKSLILRETAFSLNDSESIVPIQDIYSRLVSDYQRNLLILNDVRLSLKNGRSPIILTERKDHLEFFVKHLQNDVSHLIVLHGGIGIKKRKAIMEQLSTIPENEGRLIIATGRYIGEGFNDLRLDTLFLALPFSWKGILIQYAGRIHRIHPDKKEVQIYDYIDISVPVLMKMFKKRMKGFKTLGYSTAVDTVKNKEINESQMSLFS